MSLGSKIIFNTGVQIVARIVSTLLAAFTLGLLTRYLKQEGYGAFTIATTFPQLFGVFADFGLSLIAIQMISEAQANHVRNYNAIFTLRFIITLVCSALAPLIAIFFPYSLEIKIGIAIISISIFISSLIQILTVQFQVHLAMVKPMIAEIVSKMFLIGGIAVAVFLKADLLFILWLLVINNVIQVLMLWWWSDKYHHLRFSWDMPIFREVIRRSWPIGLSIICNLIYLKVDTIILSLYYPEKIVGIYGGAYKVFEVLLTFPSMFMGIALGTFTRSWSNGDKISFQRYFQKSFDFMLLFTIPIIMCTPFIARPTLKLLLGAEFEISGDVLSVLSIAAGLVFLGSFFGHLINVVHKQRTMLFGYAAGAMLGLIGYLATIPLYSYWGAAWVTVAVELFMLLVSGSIFLRVTKVSISLTAGKRILLAGLITTLFLGLFPTAPLFLLLTAVCIIYGGTLYAFGVIPKNLIRELTSFKSVQKT